MSETINIVDIDAKATENYYYESVDRLPDYIDPELDDTELTNLVAQNASVIVRLGGSEMTLSEATRYIPINRDNVSEVLAMVQELLAKRVMEKVPDEEEDPAEEDEPEEKESTKTEETNHKPKTQKEQLKSNTTNTEKPPKIEIELPKQPAPTANKPIRSTANELGVEPKATTWTEPKQHQHLSAKPEAPVTAVTEAAEVVRSETTGLAHFPIEATDTTASLVHELVNVSRQEYTSPISPDEVNQQIPAFEIPQADAVANPITEIRPELDRRQLVPDQETGHLTLPVAIETGDELEPAELTDLDFEIPAMPDGIAELDDGLLDLVESDVLLDDHEAASLEPSVLHESSSMPVLEITGESLEIVEETSTLQPNSGSIFSEQIEISALEQPAQISLAIEEVENSLIQLSERIETSEPEAIEEVYKVLDKIVEVPAKLEMNAGENIITEAEAQEELEELFIELLDKASIDYTPELIESLVYLTLKWQLADEIEELRDEEKPGDLPQDYGTHEIIKKLLLSLSTLKKTLDYAGAIGKSALRLYSFSVANR